MPQMDTDDKRDPQTYAVIGACMEIHSIPGPGFTEVVYHEAAKIEFPLHGIPFVHEAPLSIYFREQKLPTVFRADFLCYDDLIVEFKAIQKMGENEMRQIVNELAASRIHRGLLINFGAPKLEYKRVVFGQPKSPQLSVSSA